MNNYQESIIPLSRFSRTENRNGAGNLYYVRLMTDFGLMYKLGFTSRDSVHERLAFKGSGDEKLIDSVLFFYYFENALYIESTLHDYFAGNCIFSFYKDVDMPLIGNGQSELYLEDVLGLDEEFSLAQSDKTLEAIHRFQYSRSGKEKKEIDNHINEIFEGKEVERNIEPLLLPLIRWYQIITNIFASPDAKRKYAEKQKKEAEAKNYMHIIREISKLSG